MFQHGASPAEPTHKPSLLDMPFPVMAIQGKGKILAMTVHCEGFLGIRSLSHLPMRWQEIFRPLAPIKAGKGEMEMLIGEKAGLKFTFQLTLDPKVSSKWWIQFFPTDSANTNSAAEPAASTTWVSGIQDSRQLSFVLQELVRNFPNGTISILDRSYRFQVLGGQSLARHGIDPQALLGQSIHEVMDADTLAYVMPHYERAMAGEEVEFELSHQSSFHYLFSCTPFRGEGGEIEGIVIVNQNITHQKINEQKILEWNESLEREVSERMSQLQASRSRYQILYDQAPGMLATLDPSSGHFLLANRKFCEILDYLPQELSPMRMTDLMAPAYVPIWEEAIAMFRNGRPFPDWEFCFRTRQGKEVFVVGAVTLVMKEDGVTEEMNTIWRDVSRQKETAEALRESEFRFGMLTSSLPVMVWMTDLEGKRTYFNEACKAFSGLSLSQLQQGAWMDHIHPEDQAQVILRLEEAHEFQSPVEWECRLLDHHGKYRWVWGKAMPRSNSKGMYSGLIGAEMDIQSHKEAEQKLSETTHALDQSHGELAELSYFLSQEIQESLTSMGQYLKLLATSAVFESEGSIRIILNQLLQKNDRSVQLIQEVMSFSKVSHAHLQPVRMDLARILEELILRKGWAEGLEKAISLKVPLDAMGTGDPSLIKLLLEILVTNAVRFRDPSRALSITMEKQYAGGRKVWSISDNGRGFEPREASFLFDVFMRGSNSVGIEGHGLGLAIARRIVDRHHGHIWAEGIPGKGSTFYFSIKE